MADNWGVSFLESLEKKRQERNKEIKEIEELTLQLRLVTESRDFWKDQYTRAEWGRLSCENHTINKLPCR